jgi:hypothetical protein
MTLAITRDVQRILPGVVDRKAFFDTVTISIWGDRRQRPANSVQLLDNPAIGGWGRTYARAWLGICLPTRNPFELRYGVIRNQGLVPPLRLILWSERKPVTIDDTITMIDAICRKGWRAEVSQVELTFDLTEVSIDYFWRGIMTRAKRFVIWEKDGQETLYVGGRTSPWQLRIYAKTREVTRFEFVLRRQFLRRLSIRRLPDLERLRTLDIGFLVQLCEVKPGALKALEQTVEDEFRRRALRSFFAGYPLRDSLRAAKKLFKAEPQKMIMTSPEETRLLNMQARLVC